MPCSCTKQAFCLLFLGAEGTCAFLMTDVVISVMLIAGFVEESHYYNWENVNLGVFIFPLKSAVRGGSRKYKVFHSGINSSSICCQKFVFSKLKKKKRSMLKKCSLCFTWVAKVYCFLLLIYRFYCQTLGMRVDYSIVWQMAGLWIMYCITGEFINHISL